jgi:hypothetical protein
MMYLLGYRTDMSHTGNDGVVPVLSTWESLQEVGFPWSILVYWVKYDTESCVYSTIFTFIHFMYKHGACQHCVTYS